MLSCGELDVLADFRSVDVLNARVRSVKPGIDIVVGSSDLRGEIILSNLEANFFGCSAHGGSI